MFKSFFERVNKIVEEKPSFPKQIANQVTAKKLEEMLSQQIPANALAYCLGLWHEHPFSFTISRTRSSCYGNYIFRNGQHKITVNHDLNIYAFLVTYIHEIAHQRAWLNKGKRKIEPHGKEWKKAFQDLMNPILNLSIFPENLLVPLSQYMQNPAASSVSFAPLFEALRSFDKNADTGVFLSDITDNQWFEFRGNVFQKLEKRRTRVLCLEKISKRRYTILATARVEPIGE
jgi:SprT protein